MILMMILMVSRKRSLRAPWSHPNDVVSGHPNEALEENLYDPLQIETDESTHVH